MIGAVLAAGAGAGTVPARAGGLVITAGSPRAIGRAGAGTVGDDGGGALLVNPAAMARRDGARAQLGVAVADDEIAWQPSGDAPIARNQSPSGLAPIGAAIGSLGPWVIGIGAMTSAVSERSLIRPGDFPPGSLGNRFEFRYAGIAGSIRRDTLSIGVARRLGNAVAVGLSVAGSRVAISETRRLWAGFGGRDTIGAPAQDVEVAMTGADPYVPSLVAGVLFAPEEASLELAASIGISGRIDLDAEITAFGTQRGPTIERARPLATLELEQPVTLRAGARYLTDRLVFELDGDLWLVPRSAGSASWRVYGMRVVDTSRLAIELEHVPSRISLRTHGAVRAAFDVELVGGFLWATAGYAYAIGAVSGQRQSPTFGDLGGHTLALGLEATTGGFTFTAGWSRTWSAAIRTGSQLALDNPFQAGDRASPSGSYDGSIDQLGILIDAELAAPR